MKESTKRKSFCCVIEKLQGMVQLRVKCYDETDTKDINYKLFLDKEASLPRNWLCLRNDIVVLQLMTVIHISTTYFSTA